MDYNITKEMIGYLGRHIREIHDRKMIAANVFAQNYSDYMYILRFINTYIQRIEDYIDRAHIQQGTSMLPFVLLYSFVCVAGEDGKIHRFRVVLPEKQPLPDKQGVITVSCLTNVGGSLLFRCVGEQVSVDEQNNKMGKVETIGFEAKI